MADYTTYVLNPKNNALTQYENFPFTSFAHAGRAGDPYLAGGPDGIFIIDEGDTDDGTAINAYATTGKAMLSPQGTMSRVSDIVADIKSDETVIISTVTDNQSRLDLSFTPVGEGVERLKQEHAHGRKGVFWNFSIRNKDGSRFEVTQIQIGAVPLARRI